MKNMLAYKGYHTKIEYDAESKSLRGRIEGINDYVDFEAVDVSKIEQEFHSAVDDYLVFCKEVGKEPEKEYKGIFNVRISSELHRKIALAALKNGRTLNSEVEKAIESYVNNEALDTTDLSVSIENLKENVRLEHAQYENEKTVDGTKIIRLDQVKMSVGKGEEESL